MTEVQASGNLNSPIVIEPTGVSQAAGNLIGTNFIDHVPTTAEIIAGRMSINVEIGSEQTSTHSLGPKGSCLIDELKPFEDRPLIVRSHKQGDILRQKVSNAQTYLILKNEASTNTDKNGTEIVLFGNDNRLWMGERTGDDIDESTIRKYNGYYTSISDALGKSVTIENGQPADGFAVRIRVNSRKRNANSNIEFTVSDGNRVADYRQTSKEVRDRKEQRHRKVSRVSKVAGSIIGTILTLNPGGLVDKTYDVAEDPKQTVTDATSELFIERIPNSAVGDETILYRANENIDSRNKETQKYVDVLKQTMFDLDEHNYDAIKTRSDEYAKRHSSELMDEDSKNQMLMKIHDAKNVDELKDATDYFSQFYGFKIGFDKVNSADKLIETKKVTAAIIGETSMYPLSLTKNSQAKEIILTTSDLSDAITVPSGSLVCGAYDEYERTIYIRVFDPLIKNILNAQSGLHVTAALSNVGSFNYESNFAHEFVHSMEGLAPVPRRDAAITASGTIAGAILWNSPQAISGYATSSDEEWRAETLSGVIGINRREGLAHPDDGRMFHSGANRSMLQTTIKTAQLMGDVGAIDYLVAHNPRLMNRGFINLGA